MNDMRISDAGLAIIKRFEGLRLEVYNDIAGLETIGYGHLITSQEIASGRFSSGLTEPEALDLLRADAAVAERAVNDLVIVTLTQNQFDALCSFAFNLGRVALSKSTLLKRVNEQAYDGVRDPTPDFVAWNKAKNPATGQLETNAGLTRRRTLEADLFRSGGTA